MRHWTRSLPSSARAGLCVGLALQLALFSPLALAAPSRSTREASRKVFLQAQADYQAERYAEALEGYAEAHRLLPMEAFIFNMAQCQRLLGKEEEALALYRRYLEEAPQAKNRATVEEFVTELETAIAARAAPVLTPSSLPPEDDTQTLAALRPPPADSAPIHQQWWFWTGIAVVAGGVATGVALASGGGPALPPASLGDVSLR